MPLFIAVHGGAGYHAAEDQKATKQALKTSVRTALGSIKTTDSEVSGSEIVNDQQVDAATTETVSDVSLYAVETAIRVLEDDPILNAGCGSNLTELGTVECDAAITLAYDSAGSSAVNAEFGSVAAAPGIKNPISAARAVLQNARRVDVLGRVPPLTLCGHGARDFARAHGAQVVADDQLVSDRARADWEYWSAQLRRESLVETMPQTGGPASQSSDAHQDTVGAVCLHFPSSGAPSAAAGVSSIRGVLGKRQSTAQGAGRDLSRRPTRKVDRLSGGWRAASLASNTPIFSFVILQLSLAGTGEAIIRANLARRISEELDRAWDAQGQGRIVTTGSDEEDEDIDVIDNELDIHQILYDVLKKEFRHGGQEVGWDGCDKPTVGVLVIVGNGDTVRLYSAFTAAGMAIAYAKEDVADRRTTPDYIRYEPVLVHAGNFIASSSPLARLFAIFNARRPPS
ncbi:N-terminal nucleophile aminohydrolase [Schizophyllum commune H4-8]|nr:N-terminal nucleophile aminohydrolase [Schizophyllum commune H4-8]KAI5890731.1 N-terminal nucleophile aminohydrolase [Schizophyllum commune H4-8]